MKASVFVVTYNQEKYIRQCLDSILMQQVDFDYEVVIGEDHGTDHTRAICEEYAAKYPRIRLLPLMENLGIARNWQRVLSACEGEYIAMCEGDDYWTEPLKLQKQVNFLEQNKLYAGCFHKAKCVDDSEFVIREIQACDKNKGFTFKELVNGWIVPTASLVFRNDKFVIDGINYLAKYSGVSTDRLLVALIAYKGDLLYLHEDMSVWREATDSIHKSLDVISIFQGNVSLYKSLCKYIPDKKKELLHQVMKWNGMIALEYNSKSNICQYIKYLSKSFISIRTLLDFKIWVKQYLLRVNIN